jgi:predicted nucleic acid-binding protein
METRIQSYLPEKDMPIVLGAFLSGAESLITLDRKHLLDNKGLLSLLLPFSVMTPGDYIQRYRV